MGTVLIGLIEVAIIIVFLVLIAVYAKRGNHH
jgi:hypothetical protein